MPIPVLTQEWDGVYSADGCYSHNLRALGEGYYGPREDIQAMELTKRQAVLDAIEAEFRTQSFGYIFSEAAEFARFDVSTTYVSGQEALRFGDGKSTLQPFTASWMSRRCRLLHQVATIRRRHCASSSGISIPELKMSAMGSGFNRSLQHTNHRVGGRLGVQSL